MNYNDINIIFQFFDDLHKMYYTSDINVIVILVVNAFV